MSASMRAVSSVFRDGLFIGKTAIVTGGGTGIGRAIAEELLYLGCKVMIASRKLDKLKVAADDIKKNQQYTEPATLEYMQCNIRQEDNVKKLMETTLDKFGQIDFLVNNAGGQFPSVASQISHKGWQAVIDTNLNGTFLCCREAFTQWMSDNGGVIVNIIADMYKGFPMMSHTGAARAAVDNLTKSLSLEWASSGVRINAVAPGSSIYSESAASNYEPIAKGRSVFDPNLPNIPAKRLGTPEEISAAVCFLLSPAASFISGETLYLDGAHRLFAPSIAFQIPDHDNLPAYTWEKDAEDKKKRNSPSKL